MLIGLSQVSDDLKNSLRNPCDNCVYVQDWKSGFGSVASTKSVHFGSENFEKLTPSRETLIKNATWKCNDGNNFTLNYTNTQKDDSYRLTVHIANIMYSAFTICVSPEFV